MHEIAQTADEAEMILNGILSQLLAGGPTAQRDCKDLISYVAGRDIDTAVREETAIRIAARRISDEGQEGLSAFFEKRKPSWSVDHD